MSDLIRTTSHLKIFFITACLAATIYVSFVSYALSTIDIEQLIVCSLHPETNRFPPGLPEFFLCQFRGDRKDLETLSKDKGLSFILSDDTAQSDQVMKIATFFLNKGIDINLIGFDGLTALHSAVLQNQPEHVSYLMRNGADASIGVDYSYVFEKKEKSKMFGMSALELAKFASEQDKQDRSKIIEILNNRQGLQ
jgi:hypothetical protein